MRPFTLFALFLIVTLSGCGSRTSEPTQQTSTTTLPRGQQVFITHCVSCHQGNTEATSPNAVILDSETLKSEASFRELVRHPKSTMMRSFTEEELSNDDVHELYIYLQTVKTPKLH
jgi:mono/diheme cytochrome c family protein